jgi:hypothetical protein
MRADGLLRWTVSERLFHAPSGLYLRMKRLAQEIGHDIELCFTLNRNRATKPSFHVVPERLRDRS